MRVLVFILAVVASLVVMAPSAARQGDARLDALFAALSETASEQEAQQLELSIWQIWMDAGREDVNNLMARGVAAMQLRQYASALENFSEIVELDPEYAEGWNKRATVYWLMDDLSASMDDIRRTLALEPRHFGAISGMGLIFMQRGDDHGALQAFEAVLKISPASKTAQMRVDQLKSKIQGEAV